MSLRVTSGNGDPIILNKFHSYREERKIIITDESGEFSCEIQFAFDLSGIPEKYFKEDSRIEQVYFLRRNEFDRGDVEEIKTKVNNNSRVCAIVFALSAFSDDEAFIDKESHIRIYLLRAMIRLLNPSEIDNFPIKTPNNITSLSISDFYEEDLLVCVVSKESLAEFDDDWDLSLLFALRAKGYFLIRSTNALFQPPVDDHSDRDKKVALRSWKLQKLQKEVLVHRAFAKAYISLMINSPMDAYSRFMLSYQWIEVLCSEISSMALMSILNEASTPGKFKSIKLKEKINEYIQAPKLISIAFAGAIGGKFEDGDVFYSMFKLMLESSISIGDENLSADKILYLFRNQIVHNFHAYHGLVEKDQREFLERFNSISLRFEEAIVKFIATTDFLNFDLKF